MKPNPVLEEAWRIKDELAREANYDIHTLCEQTREWAALHPHPGPVIENAEDVRGHFEKADAAEMMLCEKPAAMPENR